MEFSHGGVIIDQDYNAFEAMRHSGNQRIEPLDSIETYLDGEPKLFWFALCAEAMAIFRTVRQVDLAKLIVVDLDDTLWRGTIGDVEIVDRVFMLEGLHLGFVEALSYVKSRGILLAIASKNDGHKVRMVWQDLFGDSFPLTSFASVKINWRSKSENIKEILLETNLLPKSTVFVDDNPRERAEVQANFPEIRILGSDFYSLRRVLLWAPETQVTNISDELAKRTELVQQQIAREEEKKFMDGADFVKSLQAQLMVHRISDMSHFLLPRSLELINKTNQFNTTGERWTLESVRSAFQNGATIYAFEVQDRFSKYGTVIVSLVLGSDIRIFVMSCRVIGLEVELAALSIIAEDALNSGLEHIEGKIVATEANLLSRDLFARAGFIKNENKWVLDLRKRPMPPEHVSIVKDALAS